MRSLNAKELDNIREGKGVAWQGIKNDIIALVFGFVHTRRTDEVGVSYFVTPMLIFIESRVSAWIRASSN